MSLYQTVIQYSLHTMRLGRRSLGARESRVLLEASSLTVERSFEIADLKI